MPEKSDNDSTSDLALVGAEIVNLFHRSLEVPEICISDPKYSAGAWKNESQRFNLWADNLGLHHRGHSSLQYRLREAAILEGLVKGLLNDLRRSLHDCEQFFLLNDDKLNTKEDSRHVRSIYRRA